MPPDRWVVHRSCEHIGRVLGADRAIGDVGEKAVDELDGTDFDRILLGVQTLDQLPDEVAQKFQRTVDVTPDSDSNTLDVSG